MQVPLPLLHGLFLLDLMEQQIKTILQQYQVQPRQENGRSLIFDCPSCGGKKKLYIEKESGRSACFKQGSIGKCPQGSLPEYALHLIIGIPSRQIKDMLYNGAVHIKKDLDKPSFEKQTQKITNLKPIGMSDLPMDIQYRGMKDFKEGADYLLSRGINSDICEKYMIGYSPSMRRVIFPVKMNNKIYGWQGRAIDKVDKKYRMYNLPGPWKAKSLMFYDNLKDKDYAIIAEGGISALKFDQVGGVVASMGKMISKDQLKLIINAGIKKIYLALDRDAFAINEEVRYYITQYSIQCFKIEVPEHRDDFGDCTFEECQKAFAEAKPLQDATNSGDWNVDFS